ncbi:H-NS histone family protein [Paraburkholderia sp. CNPSo 3076]|uniref:H-NS family nucleoid-associated regulatory protein n=1 Tax=Paraburkholderia sp. CNPSo 3076 TaxID=2940936 RepID=UPI00224D68F3|nr:H-NS family nucleoid-associated regulatory protein [Paraburkholderia sp. CNPSo 3076]MCX5543864.1 H-NS histone family protein [Paraburkholderia sp. CNPSo 3076]
MATLQTIHAKIAKLQSQAEDIAKKQSSSVLEKIRALMEKHGVTTADIDSYVGGKRRGRKPSANVSDKQTAGVAKYRDPKSGATWTGHGRAPAWIANAKDRSKFLVSGASATSAAPAKKAAKAGNYVRGPQPPKYRDPKSGATWSGRGRAPAWIAGAKDPSKFLIAENEVTATAKKPAAAQRSTVAKKATAAKKVAKKVARRAVTAKAAPKADAAVKKVPGKKPSVRAQAPKKTAPAKRVPKAAIREAAAKSELDSATVAASAAENI